MTDYNSIVNQNIKSKFVGREIYCCLTDMVNDLIEAEKIDVWEHLEFYGKDNNGNQYTENERDEKLEELREELEEKWEAAENNTEAAKEVHKLREQIEDLENMEFETLPEVYEWWGVSSWLAEKLKEQGQVIISDYMVDLWGRQTTGQAILLDAVISRICEGMEILEGQQHDWSK